MSSLEIGAVNFSAGLLSHDLFTDGAMTAARCKKHDYAQRPRLRGTRTIPVLSSGMSNGGQPCWYLGWGELGAKKGSDNQSTENLSNGLGCDRGVVTASDAAVSTALAGATTAMASATGNLAAAPGGRNGSSRWLERIKRLEKVIFGSCSSADGILLRLQRIELAWHGATHGESPQSARMRASSASIMQRLDWLEARIFSDGHYSRSRSNGCGSAGADVDNAVNPVANDAQQIRGMDGNEHQVHVQSRWRQHQDRSITNKNDQQIVHSVGPLDDSSSLTPAHASSVPPALQPLTSHMHSLHTSATTQRVWSVEERLNACYCRAWLEYHDRPLHELLHIWRRIGMPTENGLINSSMLLNQSTLDSTSSPKLPIWSVGYNDAHRTAAIACARADEVPQKYVFDATVPPMNCTTVHASSSSPPPERPQTSTTAASKRPNPQPPRRRGTTTKGCKRVRVSGGADLRLLLQQGRKHLQASSASPLREGKLKTVDSKGDVSGTNSTASAGGGLDEQQAAHLLELQTRRKQGGVIHTAVFIRDSRGLFNVQLAPEPRTGRPVFVRFVGRAANPLSAEQSSSVLLPGDVCTHIDQVSVAGETFDEVLRIIMQKPRRVSLSFLQMPRKLGFVRRQVVPAKAPSGPSASIILAASNNR